MMRNREELFLSAISLRAAEEEDSRLSPPLSSNVQGRAHSPPLSSPKSLTTAPDQQDARTREASLRVVSGRCDGRNPSVVRIQPATRAIDEVLSLVEKGVPQREGLFLASLAADSALSACNSAPKLGRRGSTALANPTNKAAASAQGAQLRQSKDTDGSTLLYAATPAELTAAQAIVVQENPPGKKEKKRRATNISKIVVQPPMIGSLVTDENHCYSIQLRSADQAPSPVAPGTPVTTSAEQTAKLSAAASGSSQPASVYCVSSVLTTFRLHHQPIPDTLLGADDGESITTAVAAVTPLRERTAYPATSTGGLLTYDSAMQKVRHRFEDKYYAKLITAPPEEETSDAYFLDDPNIKGEKRRKTLALQGYRVSVIPFVEKHDMKQDVNEQFYLKHPNLEAKGILLTAIRKTKVLLLSIAMERTSPIEVGTIAYAVCYFERLILKRIVTKDNRKLVAAVCLVLAIKFWEGGISSTVTMSKKLCYALDRLEELFELGRKEVLENEFQVFVLLEFQLMVPRWKGLQHFMRLLGMYNLSPEEYLAKRKENDMFEELDLLDQYAVANL